jgi:hypothetical protein
LQSALLCLCSTDAEVRRLESDLRALTARLGDAERQCGNLREGIAERERAHSTDVRRLTEQATHRSFPLSAHASFRLSAEHVRSVQVQQFASEKIALEVAAAAMTLAAHSASAEPECAAPRVSSAGAAQSLPRSPQTRSPSTSPPPPPPRTPADPLSKIIAEAHERDMLHALGDAAATAGRLVAWDAEFAGARDAFTDEVSCGPLRAVPYCSTYYILLPRAIHRRVMPPFAGCVCTQRHARWVELHVPRE